MVYCWRLLQVKAGDYGICGHEGSHNEPNSRGCIRFEIWPAKVWFEAVPEKMPVYIVQSAPQTISDEVAKLTGGDRRKTVVNFHRDGDANPEVRAALRRLYREGAASPSTEITDDVLAMFVGGQDEVFWRVVSSPGGLLGNTSEAVGAYVKSLPFKKSGLIRVADNKGKRGRLSFFDGGDFSLQWPTHEIEARLNILKIHKINKINKVKK
jgi:hypothetical protein